MMEYVIAGIGVAILNRYILKHRSQIKGYFGERKLARAANRLRLPGKIKVLRDSLFHTEWGKTSQVDVLAVTRYGVLVLENKNYDCDVYGGVGDRKWAFKYPGGGLARDPYDQSTAKRKYCEENLDYSPIAQNNTHASVVAALLKEHYPQVPVYPLVVFSDKANLYVKNSRNKVCNLKQLGKTVSRIVGEPVLTDKQVKRVCDLLEREQIKGHAARRKHVKSARQTEKNQKDAERSRQLQEEIFRLTKGDPILSANGEVYTPGPDVSAFDKDLPLNQMIQAAQQREQRCEQGQTGQGRTDQQHTR